MCRYAFDKRNQMRGIQAIWGMDGEARLEKVACIERSLELNGNGYHVVEIAYADNDSLLADKSVALVIPAWWLYLWLR